MKKSNQKYLVKACICFFCIILFSFFFVQLLLKAIGTETEYSIQYGLDNTLDYNISLLDNDDYENELGEELQYISSIVDKINLKYLFRFSTNYTTSLDLDYKIIAKLNINEVGNKTKVLYSKEDIIYEETNYKNESVNNVQIYKEAIVDFQTYNDYVNSFNSRYSLLTESTLTIFASIEGENNYLDMSTKNSIQNTILLEIPLGQRTFSITKNNELENKQTNIVEKSNREWINLIYLLISVVSAVIVCIFSYYFLKNLNKVLPQKTVYYKKMKKLLKVYDRVIVITNKKLDIDNYNIIDVVSFEELLDVRDNLEKPILFYEVTKNKQSWFYIIENDNLYRFTLKASEVNEKK